MLNDYSQIAQSSIRSYFVSDMGGIKCLSRSDASRFFGFN